MLGKFKTQIGQNIAEKLSIHSEELQLTTIFKRRSMLGLDRPPMDD